jgi:hypothetical protein
MDFPAFSWARRRSKRLCRLSQKLRARASAERALAFAFSQEFPDTPLSANNHRGGNADYTSMVDGLQGRVDPGRISDGQTTIIENI